MLALLCLAVTSAWATEKSIDDIAVDDIIKLGDVISYTNYMEITYDGHTITLGNFTGAGTVTVTRGIPDYTNVEDANGAYFLFNDSKTGLQGSYGLPNKTIGGIPYNESGLKVTVKTSDEWGYYLTVELAPAPAEPVASWVGNSAINANGTWYYAGNNFGWCTGGAFNGADLGTITTLSLGGQSQAWAEGNADWNDGNLTMTMGYNPSLTSSF